MFRQFRLHLVGTGFTLAILATVLLLQTDSRFILGDDFLPHGQCLLWDAGLLRIYAVSDLLIALAYATISGFLVYLVYKTRSIIPFHWIFLSFGAFIFFCGVTHLMDVLTLWSPIYWTAGGAKVMTAFASITTALALPATVPKVLALIESARQSEEHKRHLIKSNQELENEIAERRRIEDELQAALEREQHLNEFRRQFVIRMSHEFRTPLAVAQSSSDLLITYHDQMTEVQKGERLGKIQNEIDHMARLLDDILTVGRLDSGYFDFNTERVNLETFCRETVGEIQMKNAETHRIEFDFKPPCGAALIDVRLMRQTLINLLENAVTYSPSESPIRVQLRCDREQATIQIEDQGIGVPPEDRDHIFDYFYRGRNAEDISGTGLGLSIAKQAVELHGGTLILDAERAQGSVFTLTLPLAYAP